MKKTGEKKSQKEYEKDDEEQSRRFVETAERLESDKNGKSFKDFFSKLSGRRSRSSE